MQFRNAGLVRVLAVGRKDRVGHYRKGSIFYKIEWRICGDISVAPYVVGMRATGWCAVKVRGVRQRSYIRRANRTTRLPHLDPTQIRKAEAPEPLSSLAFALGADF